MKYLMIVWIVLLGLLGQATGAEAFVGRLQAVELDVVAEASRAQTEWGPLECRQGEIVEAASDHISLRINGGLENLRISPQSRIFLNGRPGNGVALRPVAPGCYILARIWVDSTGCARLIDGRYEGEPVQIQFARRLNDGRLVLTVQSLCPSEDGLKTLETDTECAFSPDLNPERLVGEAFIVYDFDGQIRAVLLL